MVTSPFIPIPGAGDDHAAGFLSWMDAQSFTDRLNELNDGFRYRLPTEAEWEYGPERPVLLPDQAWTRCDGLGRMSCFDRKPWAKSRPIRGDCTTCMGTHGNGYRTIR